MMKICAAMLLAVTSSALLSLSSAGAADPSAHFSTVSSEHTIAPGGANQVKGTHGKIGDWFFDGRWRFRVNSVEKVDEYQCKYSPSASKDKPSGANDELVVCFCTLKNGMSTTDSPVLSSAGLRTQVTALTDDQGESFAPTDFDSRNGGVVPGGAKSFAVIFSVPKGTNLSELIFSIYSFANSTNITNVRVRLAGV